MAINLYLAFSGAGDLIESSREQAKTTAQTWDGMWNSLLDRGEDFGILWTIAVFLTNYAVAIAFLGFATAIIVELSRRNFLSIELFQHCLWLLFAMWLLADNGEALAVALKGGKVFNAKVTEQIFSFTYSSVSAQEAIQDILVTNDLKIQIQSEYAACHAKTGKDQLDCIVQVGEQAESAIEDAEQRFGPFAGLIRLGERNAQAMLGAQQILGNIAGGDLAQIFQLQNPLIAGMTGSVAQFAMRYFLKAVQWCIGHIVYLGLILATIGAAPALALSIIPLNPRPIWGWLQGFFSLMLFQWSYALIVGAVALAVVAADGQEASDLGFLILLSLGAPILSFVMAKGGGTAVFQGIATAGAIVRNAVGFL